MNDDEREVLSQIRDEYQDLIAGMVHLWPWQLRLLGTLVFIVGVGVGLLITLLIP